MLINNTLIGIREAAKAENVTLMIRLMTPWVARLVEGEGELDEADSRYFITHIVGVDNFMNLLNRCFGIGGIEIDFLP